MTIEGRLAKTRQELVQMQDEIIAALRDDRSRARGPMVRQLHEIRRMLSPEYRYASQAGQDAVIDRHFQGKTGGTFVDVGGYDGLSGSNSYFFETMRKWTGVLVEPVAAQIAKARAVRHCPCLEYAVAQGEGQATFIAVNEGYTQMSGLAASYDQNLLSKVRADPRHAETEITVATRSLSQILHEANLLNPDFISLDIEGGEIAVLESFPFAKHAVGAWAIENNTSTALIGRIMRENGYQLIEFCGPDDIFVRI